MRFHELPSKVRRIIEECDVLEADILYMCQMDLSLECEYIKGYVFISVDKLGVIFSEPLDNEMKYFRGASKIDQTIVSEEFLSYGLKQYLLKDISVIRLERMLATSYVYVTLKGVDYRLCACTNMYLAEMNEFIKRTSLLLKGDRCLDEIANSEIEEDDVDLYCPDCGTMYPDRKRKICPKCMNKRSVFFRTMRYFLRYRWKFIVLFLCYFSAALINLVWPYLSGTILYDEILTRKSPNVSDFGVALLLLVGVMVVAKVVQQGISMLQLTFMAQVVARTVRDMKKDVFASMGKLSMHFYTSKQTGSLMTRVLSDADRVTNFYLDGFPYIFVHTFSIVASFIVMFRMNWKMASMACVLLPLLVVMSVKLKPKLWGLFGRRHRAERSVNGKVNDNLTGARVVKAFGQEGQENQGFVRPNERLKEAEIRIVKYNNRFTILYNLVQEVSSIWVWIVGVILLLNTQEIQLGDMITFVGYVAQLNGPMNFFSRVFHMWTDSINSAQRMFEIMDSIPEIQEISNPMHLRDPKGEVSLEGVTFGYDVNNPVLRDINLHVKPGEMLGIVGRSGAGKTTLVNLISRLYDTNEGCIKIDGIDVRDLSFTDLRRNVAMVSQDTYIFMGTVAENIAYANQEATMEEIIRAARLASAHDFIARMPDGYDTVIGASGKELSGGEKQRISIARAVLADPKILILDEATASVDTETEKSIQQSLQILVQGRTTLSIAHRLSTLRDADHLIVIDQGCIIEEGTRQELVEKQGTYYMLSELQTKSLALRGLE